jgi:D-alanyl-D-alanine carboxypeptidase
MDLICLVYKDESSDENDRWNVAKKLFEWGFENKRTVDAASLLDTAEPARVQVENYAAGDTGTGLLEFKKPEAGTAYVTLDKTTAEALQSGTDSLVAAPAYTKDLPLQAPIKKGDVLGTVTYTSKASGEPVYTCDLVASRDVLEADSSTSDIETVITTLPPVPDVNAAVQSKAEIWYWLIVPAALVTFLIIRLVTTRRGRRFKKRIRYSYRIK